MMMLRDKNNDKGFILILALVTMVSMTIIGISLVMNMTTDMQLSRNERDAKTAFQLAEAGINEAIARVRLPLNNANYIGELTTDGSTYRTANWNLPTNALSKDIGAGYGGARESMDSLGYEVEISYLTEDNTEGYCDTNEPAAGTNTNLNAFSPASGGSCSKTSYEVVMFGQDFNIDASVSNIAYGILPVYKISSTGTANSTTREIEAFVGASSLYTDTDGALNTNSCLEIAGGSATITGGVQEAGVGCGGGRTPVTTVSPGASTRPGTT